MQGWEPKRVTEYVYEDGQVVSSVTTTEAEWDDEQVALVIAHLELENDLGPHGQPMSEATSPLANPKNPKGKWWYKPTGPFVDYAEKARVEAREAHEKSLDKDEHVPPWMMFGVTRVERPRRGEG